MNGAMQVSLFVSVLAQVFVCIAAVCSDNSIRTLHYDIKEGLSEGTEVGNIATQLDSSLGPPYSEFFLEDWIKNIFDIDYSTGLIKTKVALDREANDSFSFSILKGSSNYICITITVLDVNDFAPVFSVPHKFINIPEGAPHHKASLGSVVDQDIGENTIKGFRLVSGNDDYAFNINGRFSGPQKLLLDLVINGTLDYETTPHYKLLVAVYDGGSPPFTSTMQVDINITDTNDNYPLFNQSKYSAAIHENATRGTSILQVQATDIDEIDKGKIRYSIARTTDPDGCFVIDAVTGVIRLDKLLDYETKSIYKIFAIASDGSNVAQAVVEIEVLNINEIPANIYITYLTSDATPRIPENASKGYVVARVSVSDPESPDTDNSDIAVSLQGGDSRFKLESTSSRTFKLLVDKSLDRELKAAYNLTIVAADSGSPPLSASKSFLLQIQDINDNAPVFSKNQYEAVVDEMSEPESSVISVTATDKDIGDNARISYYIENTAGGNSDWFQVDPNSGLVTTRGQVDCEVNSHPSFWIVAKDHGTPTRSSSVSVVVSVRDINDKEPTFDQSLYHASVSENKDVGECFLEVNAVDPDCGVNGNIVYSIPEGPGTDLFTVQDLTGKICLNKMLDHETSNLYEFAVVATDSGNFATTANIRITVLDINDNYPVFYPRNYSMNIQDSSQPGSTVITVQASDDDSGQYGEVTYSILSGNTDGKFRIDSKSGTIYVDKSLPAGERVYRLVIDAQDGGGQRAVQRADVYISVTGPGSNPPIFDQRVYRFTISEDVAENTFIGIVQAKYTGSPDGIRYTISTGDRNSFFKIDQETGTIRTAKQLDHDEHPFLILGITADIGSTPLYGTTQVNITVKDVNDNIPQFSSSHVTVSVSEGIGSSATIYSAHASDKDSQENGNGVVRYDLKQNPNNLFKIDSTSGEIHLAPQAVLDYELATQHELVIFATDQGLLKRFTSSMTLLINVQDANDNPPKFNSNEFTFSVSESADAGDQFGQVIATDADSGENGRISFSLIDTESSSKFRIFPKDGFIYLKSEVDREERSTYTLKVKAKDNGQPSLSATANVVIYVNDYNDNAPVFSQNEYHFYIEESQPSGRSVGTVRASDADIGNNAILQYDFRSAQNDFSISNEGLIRTTRSLDRELKESYDIEVTVQDAGLPVQQTTVRVKVTVTDINDHDPVIQNSQFTETVDENQSKGVRVVQIVARDPDAGDNGTISFSLAQDGDVEALKYFDIHPFSGWIKTKEVLDYEVKNTYRFRVVATDSGNPQRSAFKTFTINVNDLNDEGPIFSQSANVTFYVVENTPTGTTVGKVKAYDRDGGENGRVSYYIIAGNHFGLFAVDRETGAIYTIREIDYEESSSHDVGIKAIDNSVYNPKSSNITIKIHVIDTNDNPPVFEQDPVILTVRENTQVSTVIHKFTATDADSGINGTIKYAIINSSQDLKLFQIDPYSGKLSIARTIDYEQVKMVTLIIKATDQAPNPESQLFTTWTVVIQVSDVNDNAPVFQSYKPIDVREDEAIGYRVTSIIATDADGNIDKSGNNQITYTIKTGNENNAFKIDQISGVLTVSSALDREAVSRYSLRINAQDHGSPYLESEITFVVHITDVNDNAPEFQKPVYQANVTESAVKGAFIARVSATDYDEGVNGQLTYRIPQGIAQNYFEIDENSGLITLATSDLDREQKSSYVFTVSVQDAGYPLQFDTATVIINVTDINDSPPTFKDNMYFATIPENQEQEVIHTFVAHDADIGDNAVVTYSIVAGNSDGKFAIDMQTGVLTTLQALDRERVSQYLLTIAASDGQFSATCQIDITVSDQNDNDPVFEKSKYSKLLFEDAQPRTLVVKVTAHDADDKENGNVTYSLHNDSDTSLFEINSVSGEITTTGTFDREKKKSYSFDVLASDSGMYDRRSEKVRVEVTIGDINDNAPVFQEVPYRKEVSQGTGANMLVLTVLADDKDSGLNGEVTYKLNSTSDYFKIDSTSGSIMTKQNLGTGAPVYHNLKVIATDRGDEPLSSSGVVEITIGTGGGNNLVFKNQNYSTSLHESARVGSHVIKVELENQLSGVSFSFASGNDNSAFSIDSAGVITVQNPVPIDYELFHHMRLIVSAMSGSKYAYTTVWVNLIDINDNAPKFSQDKYVTKVYEEQERFTYVMQVTATDADSRGPNSDIIYNIIQGNRDEAFVIDPAKSGIIKTNVIVDREIREDYRLVIEAKDNGVNGTLSSTCIVKISVIDTNDNPPKLPATKPVHISEGTEVGSAITLVTANDIDVSPPVMYNFSSGGNPDNMFSIDRYSGMIRLSKQLDHERRQKYVIGIQASDSIHLAYTTLDIYVVDENDHAPEFSQQSYQVSVEELTPPDRRVVQVNATDADSGENARISYSLAPSPSSDSFYINEHTGVINTNKTILYQANQEIIQLVVIATDNGTLPLSAVVAVYIQLTSVNNYAPKFKENSYSTTINENVARGFIVMHVEATDKDTSGRNREIDYRIVSGNTNNAFVIDQKRGRIMLNSLLDRENIAEYNLQVMAKDRGIMSKNSTVNVHITVQDINDKVPYFEFNEYFKELNESFPDDVGFLKINTYDEDIGANGKIYYTITSGNDEGLFIINGVTGELFITPKAHLDYERHSYHKLIVKATDCNGCDSGIPRLSNITTVHINVTDVNEFDPEFPVQIYFEGVKEEMNISSSVFEAHANDKDGGTFGIVEYTLTGSSLFSVHSKTGLVTTNKRFDYENADQKEFQFQIIARDKGGRLGSIPVILNLVDVDEYDPAFDKTGYEFNIPGNAVKGTFIGRVKATDEDGGSAGKIVYKFNPSHKYFGVNASTGEIRVIHDLNREIDKEETRKKREINTLFIKASSGLDGSRNSSVFVDIDVDRTCPGCEMQYITKKPAPDDTSMNVVIIIVVIVSVIAVILLVIIVVILLRKRYQGKTPPPSETPMCDNDEFDSLPHPTRQAGPPGYGDVIRHQGDYAVNMTTSSDISHRSGSSGRGSAEDEEDEELAMINSSSPYLNNSNGFRKNMPDSGIQDDDNTSEPSVQNHQDYLARLGIDTAKINSKAKSGLTHSVESMHQFSDSGGGEGDGLDIDNIDYTKLQGSHINHGNLVDKNNDMGFHEPSPHMGGSLSNVINSEEEYSGSYNWDYLLDWGPQYQPLAHVFSEIARLKDDTIQPKKQAVQIVPQRQLSSNNQTQVRMVPPPMITNAPPKAITQPVSRSNRSSHSSGVSNMNSRNSTINTSLPSMPRSPISHESSFTSPALTPSFTPSLSPLATRSPSVSPVNSGRGMVSSSHSSGQNTPRSRTLNLNNNNKYVFSSSGSEQELRI
ncbi:protein dachsous-like [Mercenaria mercenaria]|uniref:protein dachsous-like n=1 Tax=Mercenaria mercenaria TaxID=6596 RepID=UPI00234E792E|nr:protein dachsous-like [Mercenaria mercenaria]